MQAKGGTMKRSLVILAGVAALAAIVSGSVSRLVLPASSAPTAKQAGFLLLPPTARITVLTNNGTSGISAVPIGVYELARIVNGGKHRKLYEPLDSGIWIRVRIDTIRELDQQYRP